MRSALLHEDNLRRARLIHAIGGTTGARRSTLSWTLNWAADLIKEKRTWERQANYIRSYYIILHTCLCSMYYIHTYYTTAFMLRTTSHIRNRNAV